MNCNYFDDFRLVEDIATGERYFLIESGNGAEDFMYREVIRFGRGGGVLTLTSLLYQIESYSLDGDGENMVISQAFYEREGQSVSAEEYGAAYEALMASLRYADYSPAGAFIWEDKAYDGSAESFWRLVQTALSRYAPI